jgi:hypothetical protein
MIQASKGGAFFRNTIHDSSEEDVSQIGLVSVVRWLRWLTGAFEE